MKNFIATISLIVGISTSISAFANFSPYPGFERLPDDHIEMVNFFEARKLALQLLNDALETDRFSQEQKAVVRQARDKLMTARVYFSSNPLNQSCQTRRIYVERHIKDALFICDEMRKELAGVFTRAILEDISQDLSHECMHLVGGNECTATRVELTVMDATLGRAKTTNMEGYGPQCGGFAEFNHLKKKSNVASAGLSPARKKSSKRHIHSQTLK